MLFFLNYLYEKTTEEYYHTDIDLFANVVNRLLAASSVGWLLLAAVVPSSEFTTFTQNQ
jgi:hypothetical protein